ncbi:MAG: NAD-dependent protein deacylase [Defluviitaleaceae bacterium]|nr:NAD-dependent protein deacylase [Defluviitaleaceae bacterium]
MKDKVLQLTEIIKNSTNTVFFGGAGVSTESNIPDFRSEKGLYSAQEKYGYTPEELLSHNCFKHMTELFFRYYKENMIYMDALPNPAHKALAWMEASGKLSCVITQNVDGLHQMAGSKNVLELHGANDRQYCVKCNKKYDLMYILYQGNCDGFIPKCACGGVVRPDVVLYGEGLDNDVTSSAVSAIRRAECLIVGGTSLAVYPAAGLIEYLPENGTLVLINKSTTPYDDHADLIIRENIGEVLGMVQLKLQI